MSIQQVQTKNILELISQYQHADGRSPQIKDLLQPLSTFFSKNPTGLPYKLPVNRFREGLTGNEEDYNDLLAFMIANIDTLYEVCFDHIEQIMLLNTALQNHLDRLQKKRAKLEDKLDDYLLSAFNSDGYFFAVSDTFNQTDYIDFSLTSAYIDVAAGIATLPSLSDQSRLVPIAKFSEPIVNIYNQDNQTYSYETKLPFANAYDGLTNTAWQIEIKTKDPGPLTAEIIIDLATTVGDTRLSKIEITPFGVQPVKTSVEATYIDSSQLSSTMPFSNFVKTSNKKMVFAADENELNVSRIKISMTKNQADYSYIDSDGNSNVFLFGISEMLLTENVYDLSASLVSAPFGVTLADHYIDAVSLVVAENTTNNTEIKYYVAEDNASATNLSDFEWQDITPIVSVSDSIDDYVVRFGGSRHKTKVMRRQPRNSNEIRLFDFNTTSLDIAQRNPTSAFFDGLDVYRLAEFDDPFISGTVQLEEGVNTTKIYHTNLDALSVSEGFEFWKDIFDANNYTVTHGQIDTGKGFLYGGDIGSNSKSVFCETFIDIEEPIVVQQDCLKLDSNCQLWDMKVYLNGKEVAYLPVGTNRVTVTWKFRKGRNQVAVLANIPAATPGNSPYLGIFNLMVDSTLSSYGRVNLSYWNYVDEHRFVNNQLDDVNSFTIYNNQIISRKKPTDNYRISYYQSTDRGPDAIRFRADFTRDVNTASLTPVLDMYRIRFAYRGDE